MISRDRQYKLAYRNGKPYAKRRFPYRRARKRTFTPRKRYNIRTGGFAGRYAPAFKTAEKKFLDIEVDDANVSATGTVQGTGSVLLLVQGVGPTQRVGRKVTVTDINWRVNYELPNADSVVAPKSGDMVRAIMYLDTQTNGATAVVTDILEDAEYKSYRNLENQGRFRIIFDKTIAMNYMATNGDGADNNYSERNYWTTFYKKCSIPIEYTGATGAITEMTSNNIGILYISKNGVAAMESTIRIRYTDF